MKYGIILILVLSIISWSHGKSSHRSTNKNFDQQGSRFYVKFAKMISCASKPLEKSCPACVNNSSGYKLFFYYQTSRLKEYRYRFMIHYKDSRKLAIVSFAGPNVRQYPKYIQTIYSSGFGWVSGLKAQVESEYKTTYYKHLRKMLVNKIDKFKKSGRANYHFVFDGHSVGGSLATLAAYDLVKSHILSKAQNHVKVYTFGGLRIGDQRFVTLVNSAVTLYRAIRNDDYVVRIPNCYYSLVGLTWNCYTRAIINRYVAVPSSPLFVYLQSYRYSSFYFTPVVTAIKAFVPLRGAVSPIVTPFRKQPHLQHHHHHEHHNKLHKPIEPVQRRPQFKRQIMPQRHNVFKRANSHQEFRARPQHKFRTSPQPQIRRPHLAHPKHQKGGSNLFHNKNLAKKQFKQPQAHAHHQHNKHLLHAAKPKIAQQEESVEERRAGSGAGEEVRALTHLKKLHRDKPAAGKPKTTEPNKPAVSPKGIPKQNETKWIKPQIARLPKLHITPKKAVNFYFQNLYYTQPWGLVAYYPPGFGTFRMCTSFNYITRCETRIALPSVFSVGPHLSYFNEDFSTCSG